MNFQDWLTQERESKNGKVSADILKRWKERCAATLCKLGEPGAAQYISDYGGKSLKPPKLTALAHCAEVQGYPDFALGFWKEAYRRDQGEEPVSTPSESVQAQADHLQVIQSAFIEAQAGSLPSHLIAGSLVTMQPVDGKKDAAWYIPPMLPRPSGTGAALSRFPMTE